MNPDLLLPLLIAGAVSAVTAPLTLRLVFPPWKRFGKVVVYLSLATVLAFFFGWWSLLFILGHPALGLALHIAWCRRDGLDWQRLDAEEYRKSQEDWVRRMSSYRDDR